MRLSVPVSGFLLVVLGGLIAPPSILGQEVFRVYDVRTDRLRVDGNLGEWDGAEFREFGGGEDAAFSCALAYNDEGIFFAARVNDERVIRAGRQPGVNDDALVLTWVHGRGPRFDAREVWLFPGITGRMESAAASGPIGRRPRPRSEIQVVEAPRRGSSPGYRLEAFIPRRLLGGGDAWHRGRFAVRMRDIDSEARPVVEAEFGSAQIDPRRLERLPEMVVEGSDEETLRTFRGEQGILHAQPRFDLRGQVSGDRRRERVVVIDRFLAVMGAGRLGGRGYDFISLPVRDARDVLEARLQDLTGDGLKEAVLRIRQNREGGARELMVIYLLGEGAVRPAFTIEMRRQSGEASVSMRLRTLRRRGGPPVLEVDQPREQNVSPPRRSAFTSDDVHAVLTPWGRVLSRQFRFDGESFVMVDESVRADEAPEAREPPREVRSARAAPVAAAAPEARPARELMRVALQTQGLSEGRPVFEQRVNVAQDRRPELVRVVDGRLVVVGEGFRDGTGYFVWQVPSSEGNSLQTVSAHDLTGDGRAELLFRVRQDLGNIQREVLLVHQFRPSGFVRILAVEVGRFMESRSVENVVVLPRGRRGRLRIRPGRARGWNAGSWNFRGGEPTDVAPLLLPWRDGENRYELRSGTLVPVQ